MNLVDQVKKIEEYICIHYEDWDLDDPVEEEYYQDYQQIPGASLEELQSLEEKLDITLPKDVQALYQYKNGSGYFSLLPTMVGKSDMTFCLMSLEEIQKTKESFQNRDALLTDFADYFSKEAIEKMKDDRIQPYLFNQKWLPFAQYCDSCFLMLDFAPGEKGEVGQIICYIHDPDKVVYVAKNLSDLVAELWLRCSPMNGLLTLCNKHHRHEQSLILCQSLERKKRCTKDLIFSPILKIACNLGRKVRSLSILMAKKPH